MLLGDSPPREELPQARLAVARAIRLDTTLFRRGAGTTDSSVTFEATVNGAQVVVRYALSQDGYVAHVSGTVNGTAFTRPFTFTTGNIVG